MPYKSAEACKTNKSQYYRLHKQKFIDRMAAWKKANPERNRLSNRASEKRRRGNMTWAERALRRSHRPKLSLMFLERLVMQTPMCPCCGVVIDYSYQPEQRRPPDQATLDKLIPEL